MGVFFYPIHFWAKKGNFLKKSKIWGWSNFLEKPAVQTYYNIYSKHFSTNVAVLATFVAFQQQMLKIEFFSFGPRTTIFGGFLLQYYPKPLPKYWIQTL